MLFGLTLPLWLVKIFASKWVRYAALVLGAWLGWELIKTWQQNKGAEKERRVYRKRSDEIREGMIRAPQHNEEGTADELDKGRY